MNAVIEDGDGIEEYTWTDGEDKIRFGDQLTEDRKNALLSKFPQVVHLEGRIRYLIESGRQIVYQFDKSLIGFLRPTEKKSTKNLTKWSEVE